MSGEESDHQAGAHTEPEAYASCDDCQILIYLHGQRAAHFAPAALRKRAAEEPTMLAREFDRAKRERTGDVLEHLRRLADNPNAPAERRLHINDAADFLARTYGVRG